MELGPSQSSSLFDFINEWTNEIKWNFRRFAIDSMSMLWYVWRQQSHSTTAGFNQRVYQATIFIHSTWTFEQFHLPYGLARIWFSKAFNRFESLLFCLSLCRVGEHYSWQLHNHTILFVEFYLRSLRTMHNFT